MSHNPSSSVILTKKYIITPKVLVYESFISYTHLRLAANLRMTLNTSSSCLHPLRAKSFFILSTSSSHLVFFGVFFFFFNLEEGTFLCVVYTHAHSHVCKCSEEVRVWGLYCFLHLVFFYKVFPFTLRWPFLKLSRVPGIALPHLSSTTTTSMALYLTNFFLIVWVLRIWIPVLMLSQKILHLLSCLSISACYHFFLI